MPRIRNVWFKIDGKDVEFTINYNSKNGFELKNFPSSVLEIANARRQYKETFKTEDELLAWYQDALDKYHDVIKVEHMVILYKLQIPRHLSPEVDRQVEDDPAGKIDDFYDNDGTTMGFNIAYRVLKKCTGAEVKYLSWCPNRFGGLEEGDGRWGNSGKNNNEFEMDWTQEREDFFKSIQVSADEMVKRILDFFMAGETRMAELIDVTKGQKLLF